MLSCLIVLSVASMTARAEITATVDRDRVALGDTLRLTISANEDNEDVSSIDLRPLQADFEILQRSTSSSTSIVNGRRSHTRQVLLDITPRREGELKIPRPIEDRDLVGVAFHGGVDAPVGTDVPAAVDVIIVFLDENVAGGIDGSGPFKNVLVAVAVR